MADDELLCESATSKSLFIYFSQCPLNLAIKLRNKQVSCKTKKYWTNTPRKECMNPLSSFFFLSKKYLTFFCLWPDLDSSWLNHWNKRKPKDVTGIYVSLEVSLIIEHLPCQQAHESNVDNKERAQNSSTPWIESFLTALYIGQMEASTSPLWATPVHWSFEKQVFKFPSPQAKKLFKCPITGLF